MEILRSYQASCPKKEDNDKDKDCLWMPEEANAERRIKSGNEKTDACFLSVVRHD